MQSGQERFATAGPSTTPNIGPPPVTTRKVTPSASNNTMSSEETLQQPEYVRTPYTGRRSVSRQPQPNLTPQAYNPDSFDEMDRDAINPDNSPAPAQFLAQRGRPLSFYDMKQQQEQRHSNPRPQLLRNSWRGSGEMPYNYADMIGARYSGAPVPPRMGAMAPQAAGGPYPPNATDMYMGLPWTMWMNSEFKNVFVAALGEWAGTTLFLFFAFAGTQVANAQSLTPAAATTTNATAGFSPIVMLYIAVSFGFSLMVNVWVFFRISGGMFNPAVTFAMWATGAVTATRGICLFVSQIIGSITASALVLAMFPTPLNVRTTVSEGTSLAQGVFIEALMTSELVFTILMLAKERHKSTFIAPIGIGLALFVAELVGVYYTGGSLNPARSLGPCIVTNKYDSEHWIYWVGPGLGSILSIGFYKFIKMLEYEMANPGQDGDDENDPTKNPNHEIREKQRQNTQKVLQSLGRDGNSSNPTAHASLENMSRAEEGGYYGNRSRATSFHDMADENDRRANPTGALSPVASMGEMNSPVYHTYATSERTSSERRPNGGSA